MPSSLVCVARPLNARSLPADGQHRSGQKRAAGVTEGSHRRHDVIDRSEPPRGHRLDHPGAAVRVRADGRVQIGRDEPGGDGVDLDAVARPLDRHAAGERDDGRLRRAVGGVLADALERVVRGDVHDPAVALGGQDGTRRAGDPYRAEDVCLPCQIPRIVTGGEQRARSQHTRAIDKQVQPAEVRHRRSDEALDGGVLRNVHDVGVGIAATSGDAVSHRAERGGVPTADRDPRSGCRQRLGDRCADPPAGTGDDGPAAGQIRET